MDIAGIRRINSTEFWQQIHRYLLGNPDRMLFLYVVSIVGATWAFAYGFEATNVIYSHDGLMVESTRDTTSQLVQGRFVQPLYWQIRGLISAPVLLNGLAVIYLSFSVLLIVQIFEINNPLLILLAIGVLTVNPANTFQNSTYICWIDIYQLAQLLSITSLYCLTCGRGKARYFVATLTMVLSLGLYQSYLSEYAFLALAIFVKRNLSEHSLREALIMLFSYLIVAICSVIAWYALFQLILQIRGLTATTYNGYNTLGNFEGISIPSLLLSTYLYPIQYLLHPETFHPTVSGALTALLFLFVLVCILIRIVSMGEIKKIVCTVLAILLMPFAINCIYFFSKGAFHSLMVGPYFASYVCAIAVLQSTTTPKQWLSVLRKLSLAILIVVIFFNVVFANECITKKAFIYQSTDSLMTRVLDRIEQTDGYIAGETPVAFIGKPQDNPLFGERTAVLDQITGVGFTNSSITHTDSNIHMYLKIILGYNYEQVPLNTWQLLSSDKRVKEMGVFPANDSVEYVDDVLVVKLSATV